MISPEIKKITDFRNAERIENFRITDEHTLKKREGSVLIASFDDPIRGAFSANLSDGEKIFVVAGNYLYKLSESGGSFAKEQLGELPNASFASDSENVNIFLFAGKLYIMGGGSYYSYDGTTLAEVEGYIPIVRINGNESTVGDPYEPANLLTPKRRALIISKGEGNTYKVEGRCSIHSVYINDILHQNWETYMAGNTTFVRFAAIPSADDEIVITYSAHVDYRSYITSCKHCAVYGGDADTRVFMYGGENSAVIYPSELSDNINGGTIGCEYFPEDAGITIGDGNVSVTGAVRQFDRLAIFTEDGAFYTYPEKYTFNEKILRYRFPIMPLNSEVGATKCGGAVIVENEPYAFSFGQLYRFKSTSVRDERLAVRINSPEYISEGGNFFDNCRLFVNRYRGELWCYYNGKTAIYSARNDCWFVYSGFNASGFYGYKNQTGYFYSGNLFLFAEGTVTDGTNAFSANFQSGEIDLSDSLNEKNLFAFSAAIEGEGKLLLKSGIKTDKGDSLTFDFASFGTELPSVVKTRAHIKRLSYLTFWLHSPENESDIEIKKIMFCLKDR